MKKGPVHRAADCLNAARPDNPLSAVDALSPAPHRFLFRFKVITRWSRKSAIGLKTAA
jgi:hypothetical protein